MLIMHVGIMCSHACSECAYNDIGPDGIYFTMLTSYVQLHLVHAECFPTYFLIFTKFIFTKFI
jgi:hypothetical protein